MKEEIKKELLRLQQQHNICILYAVESGSRAWGFASVNSDWDVRYLYIERPEWYLSIDNGKDSREEILPSDIDLSGWELRKALRLFRKSNPPLLEWLRSPIVYMQQHGVAAKMQELAGAYFSPKNCLYHYLSMAAGNYRAYLQTETVRTKKYFYVLRPILACMWIEQYNTMAPMEFEMMLNQLVTGPQLLKEINHLLERKKTGEELNEEPRIPLLNEYLEERIQYFTEYCKNQETHEVPGTELLNRLFRETLKEAWAEQ